MPANPKDAKGLLKSAIRDDNPIVFIEGEMLYADQGEIPDGEYTIPLGVAEVKRAGTDITIIGWSKMVKIALADGGGAGGGRHRGRGRRPAHDPAARRGAARRSRCRRPSAA